MTEVYLYADETGDLGYESDSLYFGIGTAAFVGDHRDAIWEGFALRTGLEADGIRLPRGLHAKADTAATRAAMFELIGRQAPRLDTTFLFKPHAYPDVRARGPAYLYQEAFFLHVRKVVGEISEPGDRVFVIAGDLQASSKRRAIDDAVGAVCRQLASDRTVVACVWEARTCWGIQVADYALWSTHRALVGHRTPWHSAYVLPTLRTTFLPWGPAREPPEPEGASAGAAPRGPAGAH